MFRPCSVAPTSLVSWEPGAPERRDRGPRRACICCQSRCFVRRVRPNPRTSSEGQPARPALPATSPVPSGIGGGSRQRWRDRREADCQRSIGRADAASIQHGALDDAESRDYKYWYLVRSKRVRTVRERPTIEQLAGADLAVLALKAARTHLRRAGAKEAAGLVSGVLKSAKGARRQLERRLPTTASTYREAIMKATRCQLADAGFVERAMRDRKGRPLDGLTANAFDVLARRAFRSLYLVAECRSCGASLGGTPSAIRAFEARHSSETGHARLLVRC